MNTELLIGMAGLMISSIVLLGVHARILSASSNLKDGRALHPHRAVQKTIYSAPSVSPRAGLLHDEQNAAHLPPVLRPLLNVIAS